MRQSNLAAWPASRTGVKVILLFFVEDNVFDWSYVIILIKTALRLLKLHQVMNFKPNNREIG